MRFGPLCTLVAAATLAGCSDAPDPDPKSPNPHARFLWALELRKRGGSAENIRELLGMLADPAPLVRSGAISSLKTIGKPELSQYLIPLAVNPAEDPSVRSDAILALGALRNPDAIQPLLDILAQEDPPGQKRETQVFPRRDAAKVLVVFGKNPEILKGLLGTLNAADPSLSWRAHVSLQELTGAKDVPKSQQAWTEYLQKNP